MSARHGHVDPRAARPHATLPLLRRFPALVTLPRASLHAGAESERIPTPVERADSLASDLWFKRDDLAEPFGGNKVRALEFLLGGVRAGDRVITVGSRGSTHVLATAIFARRLGARVSAFRWPQEMNDAAERVAKRIESLADDAPVCWNPVTAYFRAAVVHLRGGRWIPAGGSSPLGALGAVNAALELAMQVEEGALPSPRRIVVPLGTGGTAAGLALGARIAGLATEVVAVRVVPRLVANRWRVLGLARATARFIEHLTGETVPAPDDAMIRVVHEYYGGGYGRVTLAGAEAAARCDRCTTAVMDPTYSAKALAAALATAAGTGGPTLFWLTFDARMTI